jgi:hypothetical protein
LLVTDVSNLVPLLRIGFTRSGDQDMSLKVPT